MKKRRSTWLALILSFSLLAAACGDDDATTAAIDGTGAVPEAEGTVIVSGSSTVEPISAQVGAMLIDAGSGIAAEVDGPGTGDGFKLFGAGDSDISDASRPIKEEEAAECAANGVDFIELKVAFDGISVLTSPDNDAIECLSFADLYALIGPEADGTKKWSDNQAVATELGSTVEYPDTDLKITAPGQESGTYDSFLEARLEAGKIAEDAVATARKDYSSQADDTAIIAGIEGSDSSLGWVGFAFAEEAGEEVKELAVSEEPGGECVAPSSETIADGSYPLSRSLYIYVNSANAESNAAVAAYVDYYLADGYSAVEEVGYVALPDDQLSETKSRWEARTTGTAEA
jgi:phosphate transport system substrate-binding protein